MQASNSYGVYEAGGEYFLYQTVDGKGISITGPDKESPDVLVSRPRIAPPHSLNLHLSPLKEEVPKGFLNNPLVDIYLPKPNLDFQTKIVCVKNKPLNNKSFEVAGLSKLSNLGCPSSMQHVQMYRPDFNFAHLLDATNLIPLTIIGITPRDTAGINQVVEQARVRARRLVLLMDMYVPLPSGVEDYTEHFNALPESFHLMKEHSLRQIGNHFFLKHIQQLEYSKWQASKESL